MPNVEGTGKRLVRRPHPPPTTAPLPDDFDAITETRDSTTIYDDATNSALGIDYDDITIAPAPAPAAQVVPPTYGRASAPPIHSPVPVSPPRNLTSPPRQQQQQQHRRPGSPSHSSIAALSPDVRGSRRGAGGDGMSVGKARSVAGDRDRDRERAAQRRSLGTGNGSVPMPAFPSGKGPAKGRNDLVEKLVIEDGPERTVSVWREHIAKNGGAAHADENGTTGGGGGGGGGGDGDGRSDLDSHVGRRRVSTDSRRRVESLVPSTTGSPSVKGKGHRGRESAEFTEVSGPGSSPILPAGIRPLRTRTRTYVRLRSTRCQCGLRRRSAAALHRTPRPRKNLSVARRRHRRRRPRRSSVQKEEPSAARLWYRTRPRRSRPTAR